MNTRQMVEIDGAALSDLRSRALNAQSEIDAAMAEKERTSFDLAEVKGDLERVTARFKRAEDSIHSLEEALRGCQMGYLSTTRELEAAESRITTLEGELSKREEALSRLQGDMRRITQSRAWRLIRLYRRAIRTVS